MMYLSILSPLQLNRFLESIIKTMEVIGNSIVLRVFNEENLNDNNYLRWLRDITVASGIGRLDYLLNKSFEEVESYIRMLLNSKNDCLFAVYSEDEFIGTSKLGHIDWRTGVSDVGLMIGDGEYRGKGLSKEIVYLTARYGFDVLSLRKLSAGCYSSNIAMKKCFEQVGFKLEGELREHLLSNGSYVDHLLFGCFRDDLIEISKIDFK